MMNNKIFALGIDWQGHRGCRGLFPENTIISMMEALKYPITTLELDVVVSKDFEIIVSHEPWMSEEICLDEKGQTVKDKQFNIYKMSYADISKFDCGSKVHPRFKEQKKIKVHKPKLNDLIMQVEEQLKKQNRSIYYNIEIKSTIEDEQAGFQPEYKLFTDKVLSTIKKTDRKSVV